MGTLHDFLENVSFFISGSPFHRDSTAACSCSTWETLSIKNSSCQPNSPSLIDETITSLLRIVNYSYQLPCTMPPLSSFLCTFCWVPQYPPSPLRTLGAESRICCLRCWEQILDLAICWVCGEVVVRCEDAVSLGWCFWHRGAGGCEGGGEGGVGGGAGL